MTTPNLKKQKRTLSIGFTILLFAIVVGIQAVFVVGRYMESQHREAMRETMQQIVHGTSGVLPPTPRGMREFAPRQLTLADVGEEILLYTIFFAICSLGIYRVIAKFVDKVFAPIEENLKNMEQFVGNAGHELKTPLAVIKSTLQLAQVNKKYPQGIYESLQEVNRMHGLIESLLTLSTISPDAPKQEIPVEEIVERLLKLHNQAMLDRHITSERDSANDMIVIAHQPYLEILINNLLTNAIKYNKDKGKILIRLEHNTLSIQNTGKPIAPEHIDKIFDRFYQGNEARGDEGFGIGLSIVKKIADLYGRKIQVKSDKKNGTVFMVSFS